MLYSLVIKTTKNLECRNPGGHNSENKYKAKVLSYFIL